METEYPEEEAKVYLTVSLDDYPSFKNMKIGEKGRATLDFDLDSISKSSVTLCILNLKTAAGKRV